MRIFASVAKGKILAPPSKSMTHRYLICNALADEKCEIKNILYSDDVKATIECAKNLCYVKNLQQTKETVFDKNKDLVFPCGESASTLRFFLPLGLLTSCKCHFVCNSALLSRPMNVYENICREQGILFERKENEIIVQGQLKAGEFNLDGNVSSQFVSGLLFALPLLENDSVININEPIESFSYIEMTRQVLNEWGICTEWKTSTQIFVKGGQKYRSSKKIIEIEGDYSNAAFLDAFNYLGEVDFTSFSKVEVLGLNEKSLQGDKIYREYFCALQSGFTTLDVSDCPDLAPILFVVAAVNYGGEFTGTKRLEFKESNRGKVMCDELAKCGIRSKIEENKITIYSGNLHPPTQKIDGHNDHRIVMSMVILLTVVGGEIEGVEAVNKSYPDYFEKIKELGINYEYGI